MACYDFKQILPGKSKYNSYDVSDTLISVSNLGKFESSENSKSINTNNQNPDI